MCPACLAAAAWAVAGTTSAGGLTFFAARKYRDRKARKQAPTVPAPVVQQIQPRRKA
ncbi:hypothetical protein HNQ60_004965 [Povalibacter uvarum]|uniref:Uncharacterized protein n=1 Tax=Povalibacter uvarum TaxID=732238 RepID=A0A841HTW2_9GAMM|nr:hypothetical protein [Povalibacter uvarum]MBB6096074.1 hypothetical protein [Povalibacter uvarum]